MKSLIHNTFGGSQSLENKIKKLNTHGVTGKTIVNMTEEEAEIRELDNPEEKKVVKLS